MIRSMTGFGRGTARAGETEVAVEVRSVNGRYAEVAVRAPRALAPYEPALQARVRDALERGKISVHVQAERAGAAPGEAPLAVDQDRARRYAALLDEVRLAAGIREPLRLDDVLRFPDVLTARETDDDAEALWAATQEALSAALDAMQAMRAQEGEALRTDLLARAAAIEAELEAVERAAPARLTAARDRLHERLAALLDDGPARPGAERVDRDRLEAEVALLADKLDVTEETVRLRSHLALYRDALASAGPVGRRLNFLAQEFNREINTIASKANDAAIAHRAVTMKEELEKIREQVQNVV